MAAGVVLGMLPTAKAPNAQSAAAGLENSAPTTAGQPGRPPQEPADPGFEDRDTPFSVSDQVPPGFEDLVPDEADAGDGSPFVVRDDVPPGFEDLVAPQTTLVDLYFGDQRIGEDELGGMDLFARQANFTRLAIFEEDLLTVDAEQFATLIAPLLDGTRDLVTFETTHQRKDGSTYPVDVRLQLAREDRVLPPRALRSTVRRLPQVLPSAIRTHPSHR